MEGPSGGGGPLQDELPADACPNCGSPLRFEEGRAEGYCAVCGIYVEILRRPPMAPEPPALVRAQVLAATKRELQDLCRAYGLKVSGNKTDVLTRLLRYMDERGIDVPPDDVGEFEAEGLAEALEAEGPVRVEAGPEAETPAEVEAIPAAEPALPPVPETPEAEAAVEELLLAVEREPVVAAPADVVDPARLRRDRRRFYAGIVLTAVGGPGLVLGSVLHDFLRVPLIGRAYTVFGPLNTLVALIGLLVLLAGLVGVGLGVRGSVVRAGTAAQG